MPAVILSGGRGWHVKVGPVLVCHFRPPSGAPWLDEGWTTLSDDECEVLGQFCGWGVRRPRFFIGIGGRAATRLGIWQGARRRFRHRRRPSRTGGTQGTTGASQPTTVSRKGVSRKRGSDPRVPVGPGSS